MLNKTFSVNTALVKTALVIAAGILSAALLAVAPFANPAAGSSFEESSLEGGPVLNVGHRGAKGLAPEHTTASYDLALALGADYIEQDLRMTSDGVLVVLHDETLDRTARGPAENCTGAVSEKTLAQVKTCDMGSFFNEENPEYAREEYVGLQIPTLEEVFQRYGPSTNYYIETRSSEAPPGNSGIADSSRMEEELLRLMDQYGLRQPAAESWRVLIQSFVPASLMEIHAQDPTLPLVQLYSDETSESIRADLESAEAYAVGIGPSKDTVDPALVGAAHDRCLAIHPYTLEEKTEMRNLVGLGVDGMFTNFPNRLNEVLAEVPGKETLDADLAAARAAEAYRTCESGAGPTMPDTGGISPTLLASLGGLLVVGVGLVAATRRRALRPPR